MYMFSHVHVYMYRIHVYVTHLYVTNNDFERPTLLTMQFGSPTSLFSKLLISSLTQVGGISRHRRTRSGIFQALIALHENDVVIRTEFEGEIQNRLQFSIAQYFILFYKGKNVFVHETRVKWY